MSGRIAAAVAQQRRFPPCRALFDSLPSLLDRDAVTVKAREIDGPPAAVRAFIAAMVWGYGAVGYGPFRTNRVLECNPDAPLRLLDTAEAVRDRVRSQASTCSRQRR